jgi:POT family proton-dependent oligopeptide transporter
MFIAVVVFWFGRHRFAVVPPAGRVWLRDVFGKEGVKTIANLIVIYAFIAFFWALWDQSNGTTWSLQARSSLMDKNIGFGITLLPAQIQAVNAVFILILTPLFSYFVYPLWAKGTAVTPLRKIGVGLFVTATSFVVIAWIESRIQNGHVVSVWWQILAYVIVTAGEVLVSITALEFSYKQAPLTMKSFIMALFYLSVSAGNLLTAAVNHYMVRPLEATAIEAGAETWLHLPDVSKLVPGQTIDFGGATGIEVVHENGTAEPLAGSWIVGEIDLTRERVGLLDPVEREPLVSRGSFDATNANVSTYALVGPAYFLFFAKLMAVVAVLFIVVARFYRERTYVRAEAVA